MRHVYFNIANTHIFLIKKTTDDINIIPLSQYAINLNNILQTKTGVIFFSGQTIFVNFR